MKLSRLVVRKFGPPETERAFRLDYARRYAGQRRLAITLYTLMWIYFSIHDLWLMDVLDPSRVHHRDIVIVRIAGTLLMAAPVWLMWGRRALDERRAVVLLFFWTLGCWIPLMIMMQLVSVERAWRSIFPILTLTLFVIFTSFRLRASTAIGLVGLCVVMFQCALYLWPRGDVATRWENWVTRGQMLTLTYAVGVVFSIQLEIAARREFMAGRRLRAAKARVEAQNVRMKELVKEKERFFSSAYHDIQQPLSAINLFIRSARKKLGDAHVARHDLDVIEETARDILDMFKDIQDYSELGSYVPHVVSVDTRHLLNEVFEQYLELAEIQGIRFRISARRRSPPPIASDRALFKRALSNFVSNAIKYTRTGGVVVGWVALGDRLRIDVWDTGAGISAEHRVAIFAEYYQIDNPGRDRSKGLGLGLSIVKRVVGILPGHSMSFCSVAGRGSRFSLYAPISPVAPVISVAAQKSESPTPVLKGRYVLLCDDEPTVLEGLRRLFSDAGALVDSTASTAAVDVILREAARVPDVVVTDIRLRDGKTGIEFAHKIRRHFAWAGVLPVAFITGELVSPQELRDFATPFVVLRKSSAPESTLAEVSRLVADHQLEGSGHVQDP